MVDVGKLVTNVLCSWYFELKEERLQR